MNPAEWTLKNNRTAWTLYVLTLLIGIATFLTIGRLEYPEFTIRSAQIITEYPGRTSEQVEQEVTEPLEQSIRKLPEVDTIKSTSKPGISIISVEVEEQYFDMEDIWSDLRNRVSATRLPDSAMRPRVDDNVGDVSPYVYALTSDGFSYREMLSYAEDIRDEIIAVEGVGKVEIHGEQEERVFLEFSSSEMASYGYSPNQLADQVSSQNVAAASGRVRVGRERIDIVTQGEFENLDELRSLRLSVAGEAAGVRLDDIVDIRRGYIEPAKSISHFNGERVICLAVTMVKGGVVTEIGERIEQRIQKIQKTLPHGLEVETMFFQPLYVAKSVSDFLENLGQAFFFVVLVMLLFAGWRIAVVVGVLVPSATLACFALMPSFGVQLEMMSIAALIIALGLLVDNAVVVSEQILVRLGNRESRFDAIKNAVAGLTIPLLAASATTIAAFSPIALSSGGTSEFTYSLFAVVSLTLLSSWVLSLTVIPMLCFYFLKPLKRETWVGRQLQSFYAPYERLLRLALKGRWAYPIVILVLTIVAGMGFRFVPNIFFPPNERGQFVIDFELALGTDIEETEKQVRELEEWLLSAHPDMVESVSAWIGNGGPRWYLSLSPEPPNPNYSFLSVLTKVEDPVAVAGMVDLVHEHALGHFPDARITAKVLENGPPVGDPIQIRLYGKEMATLYSLRDRIVETIDDVDGLFDLRDNWGAWIKQLSVDPDPVRATRLGLRTSSISSALNLQFSGLELTQFRDGEKSIPVLLRSQKDFREHPERLDDLPVFSSFGAIPLSQVAELSLNFLPGSILREDTLRVMTIKGRVNGRFSSEALAEIQPLIAELIASDEWPEGYRIEYGGEQEESAKAQGGIATAMPISLSILMLILIAQFNSVRRLGIILLTIPPMLIGVVPGLIVTGSSFGFMTLLGLIALLGIIVNNAILLIDETDSQIQGGESLTEGIVKAAKSRLRPIIMTTITTIIGLLPLALGGGGMWSSMAYAMMFGLGFATLLTLVLCPVLYSLFLRERTG